MFVSVLIYPFTYDKVISFNILKFQVFYSIWYNFPISVYRYCINKVYNTTSFTTSNFDFLKLFGYFYFEVIKTSQNFHLHLKVFLFVKVNYISQV